MPEETEPPPATEPEPATVEQQIETEIAIRRLQQTAGNLFPSYQPPPITVSADGGGHYRIAGIAELDNLITKLKAIQDRIDASGRRLEEARDMIKPMAADEVSLRDAEVTKASMQAAVDHNHGMSKRMQGHIDKFTAARHAYENTEGHNTTDLNAADGA